MWTLCSSPVLTLSQSPPATPGYSVPFIIIRIRVFRWRVWRAFVVRGLGGNIELACACAALRRLDLLHRQLDQVQMGGPEARQTLPGGVHRLRVLRLVGAFRHLGARLGGVTALAQLLHQMLDVEAGRLVEQAHLAEHALDVLVRLLVVGERPGLVLGHLLLGDAVRLHAFAAILDQVLVRLDLPLVGEDLR